MFSQFKRVNTAAIFVPALIMASTGTYGKTRAARSPEIRSLSPTDIYLQEGTSNPEQLPSVYSFTIRGRGFRRGDVVQCSDEDMPKQLSFKFRSSRVLVASVNINTVTKAQRFFNGATVPIAIYDPISKTTSNSVMLKVHYMVLGG